MQPSSEHHTEEQKTFIPASEINFEKLLEQSKALKDEGNKLLKSSLNSALDTYHNSLKVFIKMRPKLATYKEDFQIEWKYNFKDAEKNMIIEHFAIIFSNCSYAYMELNKPLMALYYAKFSVWCNESFFKASLRLARALITLLHLQEAQDFLKNLQNRPEASNFQTEINSLLKETSELIQEYSSAQIVARFLRNTLNWVEEKSYIGPMEILDTPTKGRAFFATRDISRCETLLIEKGFVHGDKKAEFCYHLITKLNNQEDLKASYMNLFPCKKYPLTKELQLTVQGKIREHTLKRLFEEYKKERPIEWDNFTNDEVLELLHKAQYDSFRINGKPALFPHLCILNHSCDPNTSIWYVNDMVLVLARRDIKKGEEICVTYAPVADDKPQRRVKLAFYGFECDCLRCQEKGEWKEKVHQLNGVRCLECGKEIACDANNKFVCPKECWKGDYNYFERIDKELKNSLDKLANSEHVTNLKLKATLQTAEKEFSSYHNNKALVLYVMAKTYAKQKDKVRFNDCMKEIARLIEFYPSLELRKMLNNLLYEIISNFERELNDEELRLLSNFGLPFEATKILWKEFMSSTGKEWFLPFETGSQETEQNL